MKKVKCPLIGISLILFVTICISYVKKTEAGEDYFRDKTMTMIVATNPGGSYDQYGIFMAKALQQKLGAKVSVEYITGEGMINGANAIYQAAPDGLKVGTFNIGLIVAQLRGEKGIQFDLKKFTWLANAAAIPRFLAVRSALPYKNIEDVKKAKEPIKIPTSGTGSSAYNDVLMIKRILGVNLDPVSGYGGAETAKGIKNGIVDGQMGSVSSMVSSFQSGLLRPLLIIAEKRDPAYPDVPTLAEIAPQDRQALVKLMVAMSEIARPFAAPPGIPESIRLSLQHAFAEAFSDPVFKETAKKDKLPFQYYSPAQVQKMIADALLQPPEVVSFLKTMVIAE